MIRLAKIVLVALALCSASRAHAAAVLATAPANADFSGDHLYCTFVNGSSVAPSRVVVEGIGYDGTTVTSHDVVAQPHEAIRYIAAPSASACEFTILGGKRKDIRAGALYLRKADQRIEMVIPAR